MSNPPEPTAPPPEPPAPTGGPAADPDAGLRAALDQERKARKDLETELAKAREDGKAQAAHATRGCRRRRVPRPPRPGRSPTPKPCSP